jgi:hypothetical protein
MYQGDLAPKPIDFSFGKGNLSYGFGVGTKVVDWMDVTLEYNHGNLSGDDQFAENESRRLRNLNFNSTLDHVGLNGYFNINHFVKSIEKYNLTWKIGGGIGYDFFDPRAYFKDQLIRLQPLGTEGQNLKGHPTGPYSLSTFVTQVGFMVYYKVNKRVSIALEGWTTRTSTDYLDDVSTTYPDFDIFKENQDWLSFYLSDRSTELQSVTTSVQAGSMRGNPEKNDRYIQLGLKAKYILFVPKEEATTTK